MLPLGATRFSDPFERFQSIRTLSGIVPGGLFLRKMPPGSHAFQELRLWNRCNRSLECNLQRNSERARYRFRNHLGTMQAHITAIIVLRNPKLASGAVSWTS